MSENKDTRFSFKKWFFSLIPASGEQWGKWLDFAWKAFVIVCALWAAVQIKNAIFNKLFAREAIKPIPSVQNVSGGSVDNSSNKTEKRAIIDLCLFNCK